MAAPHKERNDLLANNVEENTASISKELGTELNGDRSAPTQNASDSKKSNLSKNKDTGEEPMCAPENFEGCSNNMAEIDIETVKQRKSKRFDHNGSEDLKELKSNLAENEIGKDWQRKSKRSNHSELGDLKEPNSNLAQHYIQRKSRRIDGSGAEGSVNEPSSNQAELDIGKGGQYKSKRFGNSVVEGGAEGPKRNPAEPNIEEGKQRKHKRFDNSESKADTMQPTLDQDLTESSRPNKRANLSGTRSRISATAAKTEVKVNSTDEIGGQGEHKKETKVLSAAELDVKIRALRGLDNVGFLRNILRG
jgi:hypothetical protein